MQSIRTIVTSFFPSFKKSIPFAVHHVFKTSGRFLACYIIPWNYYYIYTYTELHKGYIKLHVCKLFCRQVFMWEGNIIVPLGMTLKEYWKDLIKGVGVILSDSEDFILQTQIVLLWHIKRVKYVKSKCLLWMFPTQNCPQFQS